MSLFSISFLLYFIPPSPVLLFLHGALKLVVEAASPVLLLFHCCFVVSSLLFRPDGVSRNYPSTNSSVLLPLKLATDKSLPYVEVLV
uniref:Uncharacterized protein n=1 Tax=Nelumbo nucifera TaxID=4432 RepID=A0A822ZVZ3_NELNU|nr:TPA_asm: hypothetical protein HUJ06_017376 [Nelumbo nucifera]